MGSTIGISVEAILFATLGVAAISLVQEANTSTWDPTVALLGKTVVGMIIVIACILSFLKTAGYKVNI
jgi:hypothetical protein